MFAPFARMNISCACNECTTFLRPYPTSPPTIRFPPGLFPPGFGFSLPSTPITTPRPSPQHTPRLTPQLAPVAPALAPSPVFLLTKPTPKKLRLEAGPRVEEMETSPTPNKVTFASRSLWAGISSPIDDTATPISAKTPGLTTCANAHCPFKVVPSFETRVCTECLDNLRGTVDTLLVQIDPNAEKGTQSTTPHQAASHPSPFPTRTDPATDPALFAVPSTPPSTRLLVIHSLATPPKQNPHTNIPPSLDQPLFALPNTSLDTAYEDFTPTTRYTMHFPALPARDRNPSSNNDSNSTSNDINNDSSTSKTSPPGPTRSSAEQHSAHRAPSSGRRSSTPCTKALDKVDFSRRFDWGADWNRRLRDGKGWAACLKITEALRDGM